jgi:hypothetical protein
MKKITNAFELEQEIAFLEIQQAEDLTALKDQFRATYESLKPINLILNSLKDISSAPDLKGNLLNTALAIGAGFLSKKALVGGTINPFKQLAGTLLQLGVTSLVSKNGSDIKIGVLSFLGKLLRKKKPEETVQI